jgi:hypothetical protein
MLALATLGVRELVLDVKELVPHHEKTDDAAPVVAAKPEREAG